MFFNIINIESKKKRIQRRKEKKRIPILFLLLHIYIM